MRYIVVVRKAWHNDQRRIVLYEHKGKGYKKLYLFKDGLKPGQFKLGANPYNSTREAISVLKKFFPKARRTQEYAPAGKRDDVMFMLEM